jgi:hypothetical protein
MQYAVGETASVSGAIELCKSGLHFCENALDVFSYYPPAESRFAKVTAEGVVEHAKGKDDTKRVARSLHIEAEITLNALIGAGVKFILDKVDFSGAKESNTGYRSAATNTGNQSAATNTGNQSAATNTGDRSVATNTGYRSAATNTGYYSTATNTGDRSAATNTGDRSVATNTGDRSAATNTGDRSAATNTGDYSAATNTGYYSAATNTGKEGCAISLGIKGRASGAIGCWLTLAEWENTDGKWHRVDVQTRKVDGVEVKADTFYVLQSGKFTEVK